MEDQILQIMSTQLTEREVMLYLLIESGMTLRDTADRLGLSPAGVDKVYKRAKKKMTIFAEAGLFQTKLK